MNKVRLCIYTIYKIYLKELLETDMNNVIMMAIMMMICKLNEQTETFIELEMDLLKFYI